MSKCSKKCNLIKQKIDNISGLDDNIVFMTLCRIEHLIDFINLYSDSNILNGTIFKDF